MTRTDVRTEKTADGGGIGDTGDAGAEGNSRITGTMGFVLFVLLVAEGVTILLHVRDTISPHVFIGMLLVPPVAVKTASTGYRFVRYYTGRLSYTRKGPPPAVLRLLGPLVVLTTAAVLASGIALLFAEEADWLRTVHKGSFVVWFAAMAVHVIGHALETPPLAAADWSGRHPVAGRGARRVLLAVTLASALILAVWSQSWIGSRWEHGRHEERGAGVAARPLNR
ncbi:MAG: hypothetical protein U0V73_04010 [Acidimicrobiia bacterium]